MNTEEFPNRLKNIPLSCMTSVDEASENMKKSSLFAVAAPEGPEYWKTRAIIKIELDGEEVRTELRGDADKLCSMLAQSLERLIHEEPVMRRKLRKAARILWRNTRLDIVDYWLDGWPWTILGAVTLFGIVYTFASVMHWIGGLL